MNKRAFLVLPNVAQSNYAQALNEVTTPATPTHSKDQKKITRERPAAAAAAAKTTGNSFEK